MGKECKPTCASRCVYWPKPFDACLEHPQGHACDCGASSTEPVIRPVSAYHDTSPRDDEPRIEGPRGPEYAARVVVTTEAVASETPPRFPAAGCGSPDCVDYPICQCNCHKCFKPGAKRRHADPVDTPKRRIKVRPVHGGPWCVCDDWNGVGQMIEDDGAYEFAFVMMTDEEAEKLGEFNGW